MKKIIIFALIFYCISINAQNINHIKTLDTIYVKFKKSKKQIKKVTPDGNYRFYTFNLKKSDKDYLNFTKPDYNYSSGKVTDSFLPLFKEKSFLKKNKKNIIGIRFFNKYGIEKSTYTAFEKCKVIYIIDYDEKVNGKIVLYKVLKSSSYTMGE